VKFGDLMVPVFPGGYLIGGLLLINLICAHIYRFKLSWRKLGIWLTHIGVILLLVGELVSGLVQQDYEMTLNQGETKNYAESNRLDELAIIDATDPNYDEVVAIPESMIAKGEVVQNPKLPFRVVPKAYYPNSDAQMRSQAPGAPPSMATVGVGPMVAVTPTEVSYAEDAHNLPSAFIELVGPDGSLGTWLVSTLMPGNPQTFTYANRTWKLYLRPKRMYSAYSVTLEKFTHDIFPGTDIDRNFSSKVRLNIPGGGSREVLIYMNNPLRYAGLTYYQERFANNDQTSILEVVRNPSWLVPYISCVMIALGLVIQFLIHLVGFARRRRA
jgi:hypothetical protein